MAECRYVLAFDTALFGCSVAVIDSKADKVTGESKAMPRGQAEALVPMIENVIARAGVDYQELDLIAVTAGPGAFTGLRIGLSTARALALSLNTPVMGIPTMDVLAARYFRKNPDKEADLLVLLETKRRDYYAAFYDEKGKTVHEARTLTALDIFALTGDSSDTVVIGDALDRFAAETGFDPGLFALAEGYELPDMAAMAYLALDEYKAGAAKKYKAEPIYLRGADVSKPKKKYRTIK